MEKIAYSKAVGLIIATGEEYARRIKAEAEALGVKNAYRTLLAALAVKDGDTQLSLVQRTGLKAPTVSITLRKMEKEGLVRRRTDENDLRKTHVFLTDLGRETNIALENRIAEVEADIFSSLTEEEYIAFCDVLKSVKADLSV